MNNGVLQRQYNTTWCGASTARPIVWSHWPSLQQCVHWSILLCSRAHGSPRWTIRNPGWRRNSPSSALHSSPQQPKHPRSSQCSAKACEFLYNLIMSEIMPVSSDLSINLSYVALVERTRKLHGLTCDSSIGPLFIAHCFNWCAFGVLAVQVCT